MNMKVRCISKSDADLTYNRVYNVMESDSTTHYKIVDDVGDIFEYDKRRFKIVNKKEVVFVNDRGEQIVHKPVLKQLLRLGRKTSDTQTDTASKITGHEKLLRGRAASIKQKEQETVQLVITLETLDQIEKEIKKRILPIGNTYEAGTLKGMTETISIMKKIIGSEQPVESSTITFDDIINRLSSNFRNNGLKLIENNKHWLKPIIEYPFRLLIKIVKWSLYLK